MDDDVDHVCERMMETDVDDVDDVSERMMETDVDDVTEGMMDDGD